VLSPALCPVNTHTRGGAVGVGGESVSLTAFINGSLCPVTIYKQPLSPQRRKDREET
jgi:hypothetical protein